MIKKLLKLLITALMMIAALTDAMAASVEGASYIVWNDAGNSAARPAQVYARLYMDGQPTDQIRTMCAPDWSCDWGTLDDTHEYSVKITDAEGNESFPQGYYATEVECDKSSVGAVFYWFTLSEVIDLKVSKDWDDGSDRHNTRPEYIKVQLYQNGSAYGEPVKLTKDNSWSYTWNHLSKYFGAGDSTENEYYVEEVEFPVTYGKLLPDEWDTSTGKAILLHNVLKQTSTVQVSKVWNDAEFLTTAGYVRPDHVDIKLGRKLNTDTDYTYTETVELNEGNDWKFTFTAMDTYVIVGGIKKYYEYIVAEETPENYTSQVSGNKLDGYVVTNTPVSKQTPAAEEEQKPAVLPEYTVVNTADQ